MKRQPGISTRKNVSEKQGQKRFVINAVVLALACVLILVKGGIGVAQIIVAVLLLAIAAFQLLLYFKLR